MKKCSICKEEKEIAEFNKNKAKKDGYNTVCRECSIERSRKYYRDNCEHHKQVIKAKKKRLNNLNKIKMLELLKNSKCKDCGNDDERVLEFDHLPQYKKEYGISTLLQYVHSWETIEKEISKCEIVCANCHRIRTIERSEKNYRKRS